MGLSIPDPGPHGGTSLSYPTRVLVKRYMDYAHEAYLGVHYPNGTVRPGIPSNVSSLFHGSVMETPHWMTLANQTDGVQLRVSWWIGLPAEGMQYVFGFLFSIPITMFFIVDQLVSAGLAQPKELRMTKGRFYHSGLFLVGILNFAGPLVGLPFVTGALPQSPELTIQMAETSTEREKRLDEEDAALEASLSGQTNEVDDA